MTPPAAPFPWRAVAIGVYLPTLLFGLGVGAIVPIIPVVAADLGAGLALAGLIAAMPLVGHLIGDIPSGMVVARIGERRAMIAAAAIAAIGMGGALLAPTPLLLGAALLVAGIAEAAFGLARHAFLTSAVPFHQRARALSTLGGVLRFGMLLGPFTAAGVIELTGAASAVFWVHIAGSAAAAVALLVVPDPQRAIGRMRAGAREVDREARGLGATLVRERSVLGTLGVGSALMMAVRQARQVVLPLWGVAIALDETTISLVVGIAAAVDFSLFFASGWVMDRFGRLWVAAPPLVALAAGFAVLPLTGGLPAAEVWFVVVALWLALANGLSSGILMTLGADLADPRDPAPFLGAWRFMTDAGGAAAPLLVAGITAIAGLPLGIAALVPLALGGAIIMRVFVPRHPPRRPETGPIPVPDGDI